MTKLILFIIIFLLFIRIVNAIFKGIYKVTGEPQNKNKGRFYHRNRSSEGEITIDQAPDEKDSKRKSTFKGGEYIDYEDVK